MSILSKEKRKKRHLPGSPPKPVILHKARWLPTPHAHTHLWGIHSFRPAQNKLHIPLRKITQHLPLRRSECWYLKSKCPSKTCQVYLAKARPWSPQSVKRLLVTEWSVVFLWGVGVVSSALETNTLMKRGGPVPDFPFGQVVFLWNRCCLLAVTACLGLGKGLSYVSKPLCCG